MVSEVENSDDDVDLLPLTKASVLHVLKQITSYSEPSNKERYEKLFVTWKIMKSLLVTYFNEEHLSQLQTRIDQWIGANGPFGRSIRIYTGDGRMRGRWLWVLKRSHQVTINFRAAFIQHVRATPDVATIGYVRKSYGNEDRTKRVQLLQSIINKLRVRCLARKVYVSTRFNASMPLNKRDEKADSQLTTAMLSHCAGTMQDLLHRLRTNMKPIRLVVIDYAGFSTDFGDLQFLFNTYKQVVEIVSNLIY